MSQIDLPTDFDFQQAGRQVLEIEREGLAQLDQYINEDFTHACETIFRCGGKVVVMGMGKSGHIGRKMAATFASTGTSAFFVHPGEAAHGDLGMVTPQDVVIALSNSGESNEILALIPVLKRQQVKLICITSRPESSMARAADIHLCVKVPKEACPLGLAPTSSTTAALVMGDALAVALLEARGFTAEDFALSHPGGALGRKLLLRVNDIMHTGDEIPHVGLQATLRDALLEITRKNLGMTAICDDDMNIIGIFTDGDLRRVFDTGVDMRDASIADVMTRGGIRIRPGTLAVDALNLMQSRHITCVLVADGDHLLGVVHMHDLLRAGVCVSKEKIMNNADAQLATCYGPVSQAFVDRAAKIRLLILDVDGVLSDGLIYMGNHGEELKAFNVRDGYGIRCALTSGIEVAIITGRKAKLVEDRCQTLGITHLYQGQSDKLLAFRDLTDKLHVRPEEVAYIGDDLIDWPVMAEVGLSVAVADAHPLLLPRANYVTRINGGRGAVREVCDLLLLAQGKLDEAKGQSI